jgi:hypothetical protein
MNNDHKLITHYRVRTLTGKEIELDIEPDYKVSTLWRLGNMVLAVVCCFGGLRSAVRQELSQTPNTNRADWGRFKESGG